MTPRRWIIIAAILFLIVSGLPAAAETKLPDPAFMSARFLDLPYADQSADQKLDIYLPKQGEQPYPVVLRIHGDDRNTTDRKKQIAACANPLLKKGYAVVSIGYRYSSEAIFTARIYDAKAAVRFIRAVAADYELDPHRIIAWGESAGATLAALLAVSGDVKTMEDLSLGNPGQSSRIHGAILWSGIFDPLQAGSVPDLSALLTPATYITIDDPPFLIQHGAEDARVPVREAIAFAGELEKVLGSEMVFLDILEGAAHGDAAFFSPDNMEKVLNFLSTWTD